MFVGEYTPIPRAAAIEMLKESGIKEGDTLYMLSCGDGDLLIMAARRFGVRCVGIERKKVLTDDAFEKVKKSGLEDRITILNDNFHFPRFWSHIDDREEKPYALRNADVVIYYLTLQVQELLRDKLVKELRKGARVASYAFKLMGWEPVKTKVVEGVPFYIFEKGKSF
jgi:hypothetical protein